MLSFYTDPQMLRPITSATPKLFCCPDEGGTRLSTLYLGNGYKAILASPASAGATTIVVNQTQEFLAAGGTATIAGQVAAITYRSEEHTSELQSLRHLVCRLLLEKKEC